MGGRVVGGGFSGDVTGWKWLSCNIILWFPQCAELPGQIRSEDKPRLTLAACGCLSSPHKFPLLANGRWQSSKWETIQAHLFALDHVGPDRGAILAVAKKKKKTDVSKIHSGQNQLDSSWTSHGQRGAATPVAAVTRGSSGVRTHKWCAFTEQRRHELFSHTEKWDNTNTASLVRIVFLEKGPRSRIRSIALVTEGSHTQAQIPWKKFVPSDFFYLLLFLDC